MQSLLGALALLGGGRAIVAQNAPDWSQRPSLGPEKTFALPAIERVVLSNGLPLLFVARAGAPLIQISLLLARGANDDPPGQSGLAALVADAMDEGAGARNRGDIAGASQFLGINLAVRADRQSLQVLLFAPIAQLDSALALMADVALRPIFPDDEVRRLRTRQMSAIVGQRDQSGNLAARALLQATFGTVHPDGRAILGSARDLASVVRGDLVAFHGVAVRPDQAVLVVVGDISMAELRPRLDAAFGRPWPASASRPQTAATPPRPITGRTVTLVDRPGAAQSSIRIVALGPPRSSPDHYAFEVLNFILSGSSTSRIERNLRARHGFAYEARSILEYRPAASLFIGSAEVETKVTAAALREFLDELAGIRGEISAGELATAKNLLRRAMPQPFMTVRGVAERLGEAILAKATPQYYDSYREMIEAITMADVRRVARQYIDPDHLVVVIVGDRAVIEREIRGLGLGRLEIMSANDLIPAP